MIWRNYVAVTLCIHTGPLTTGLLHIVHSRNVTTPSPIITVPIREGSLYRLSYRGFRAQRFYLNLLPVLGFLHHLTDRNEPDKPVTSVFLISQHRKSYKPSKNGAICAWAYLLCAQRFYRAAVFDRTFVQTLIALCVADRWGTKVLCANLIANPVLHRAQGSICSDSTFVHYNIWLYKYLTLFCLALLQVTRFYQ